MTLKGNTSAIKSIVFVAAIIFAASCVPVNVQNNYTSGRTTSGSSGTDRTIPAEGVPSLRTPELVGTGNVIFINGTSAQVSGVLLDKGAAPVTETGICWSTSAEPGISDAHLSTPVTDVWALTITGLKENTVYYARAYAVNAKGAGYGEVISFNSGRVFGSLHAGGNVFYNDGKGGGLVLARQTLGQYPWITGGACDSTANGRTSHDPGKGSSNTAAIIAQPGHADSAAKACRSAQLEGFNDWFLPSYREAVLIQTNLYTPKLVDLQGASIWTSTEADASWAWFIDFGPSRGQFGKALKKSAITVRPVRAFTS